MLNNSISSTRSHNMVNFDPLEAEIGLPVWGTPGNFNLYRVLASLLQRRRSTEVNQTLHDVWPSRVLVQYIYTLGGGSWPLTKFYHVQNSLCPKSCVIVLPALLQSTRVACVNQTLRRSAEGATYSAGRPARWASAPILVHWYYYLSRYSDCVHLRIKSLQVREKRLPRQ